jgi:hypothetical protein
MQSVVVKVTSTVTVFAVPYDVPTPETVTVGVSVRSLAIVAYAAPSVIVQA